MKWEIRKLELEISSACNAACPSCSRQLTPDIPNPYVKRNQHLSIALTEKICSAFETNQIESLVFCGNYGDPLAHPQKISVIRRFRERFPGAFLVVHTNGSIGSTKEWKELASLLRGTPHRVRFSLDGMANTFPIYRKRLSFDRVAHNARLFIAEGGNAQWKWIDFAHTRHQIPAAKRLAEQWGFSGFAIVRDHSDFNPRKPPETDPSHFHDHPFENNTLYGTLDLDDCRAAKNNQIYIDAEARVWPCCWLADGISAREAWKRSALKADLAQFPEEFNSLNHFPLREIITHSFFERVLPESWNSAHPSGCREICLFHCAKGGSQQAAMEK